MPGTPVIPAGWNETHGAVFAKTHDATVNLRKPGSTESFDEDTERTVFVPLAPYATGQAAGFQAQTTRAADANAEQAEETLRVTGYLVSLNFDRPLAQEPAIGDLIDVTACADQLLVGRTLKVTGVVEGSRRFGRDLYATLTDPAPL